MSTMTVNVMSYTDRNLIISLIIYNLDLVLICKLTYRLEMVIMNMFCNPLKHLGNSCALDRVINTGNISCLLKTHFRFNIFSKTSANNNFNFSLTLTVFHDLPLSFSSKYFYPCFPGEWLLYLISYSESNSK